MKGVNIVFVNFIMSVARFCIFRRRNLIKNGQKNVNLIQLFRYTLKHYVTYFYVYLSQVKNMKTVFQKNFLLDNPLIEESDDVILFKL